jgi:hypothetical protein
MDLLLQLDMKDFKKVRALHNVKPSRLILIQLFNSALLVILELPSPTADLYCLNDS